MTADLDPDALRRRLEARGLDAVLVEGLRLKHEILARGVRVAPRHRSLFRSVRRTRSGVSGGLDLLIEGQVYVNAPVRETFAAESPLQLEWDANGSTWLIVHEDRAHEVGIVAEPDYYGVELGSGGRTADQVGQMCSADRFCYGITGPTCRFWPESDRCRYCSIGLNSAEDARRKTEDELLEALALAINDPSRPARHILLGGGTPATDDMGARLCADLCRGIKREFGPLPVYVMIAAPLENSSVDELHEAGVDELGINLEFWSPEAWRRLIPGKDRIVGRQRFLEAIEYAGEIFGPIRARSILISGIEPESATLDGVAFLAKRGVMPILSPFRPLVGTQLEGHPAQSARSMESVLVKADEIADSSGLPLGPACNPCQNNVLAIPMAASG